MIRVFAAQIERQTELRRHLVRLCVRRTIIHAAGACVDIDGDASRMFALRATSARKYAARDIRILFLNSALSFANTITAATRIDTLQERCGAFRKFRIQSFDRAIGAGATVVIAIRFTENAAKIDLGITRSCPNVRVIGAIFHANGYARDTCKCHVLNIAGCCES